MHSLENRTYAGAPGETVVVETEVEGGGAVTIVIDGVEVGEDPTFNLKPNPGDEIHMRVALFGAVGDYASSGSARSTAAATATCCCARASIRHRSTRTASS